MTRHGTRTATAKGGAGIAGIVVAEGAMPGPPEAGEALVRIRAATLNFRDLIAAKDLIPGLAKQPSYVPLSCAAAEVIAVGGDVTRVAVGDRVSPIFSPGWFTGPLPTAEMLGATADGVARDHAIFPADSLVLLPPELGDLEAATLPCAGLTAWTSLFGARPIRPGEWVLAQGTGGVSLAALQWAKAAGARVAITSSSDAKLARARAMGADVTANYRTFPDWAAEIRSGLGGDRVAIVVDVAGADALPPSAALLADDGIVAAVGMLGADFSWTRGAIDGHPIVPVCVGNRGDHEAMLAFAAAHGIRPVVDAVYDLDRLPDAMRHLESGRFFGKIGVTML